MKGLPLEAMESAVKAHAERRGAVGATTEDLFGKWVIMLAQRVRELERQSTTYGPGQVNHAQHIANSMGSQHYDLLKAERDRVAYDQGYAMGVADERKRIVAKLEEICDTENNRYNEMVGGAAIDLLEELKR